MGFFGGWYSVRAVPELIEWGRRAASLIFLYGWLYFFNINFVRGGAVTKLLFVGHVAFLF